MKGQVPKFSSDEEFAHWIDSHDTSEYMDDLVVVNEEIDVQRTEKGKESIDLLMNSKDLEAIKRVASSKGISYQTLIKTWLIEKLREASESRPRR